MGSWHTNFNIQMCDSTPNGLLISYEVPEKADMQMQHIDLKQLNL